MMTSLRTADLRVACAAVLLFAASNCFGDTLQRVKDANVLRCGVIENNRKFSELDQDGKWDGYDVAFCQAISQSLGVALRVVPLAESRRIEALAADQSVDVVVAYPNSPAERERFANHARRVGVTQPYVRLVANDRSSFASILTARGDAAMLNWLEMFIWDIIRTGEQGVIFQRYFGYQAPPLRFP